MRLPAKDSATWRGLITSLQTFLAFIVALFAMPEFGELVTRWYPAAVPLMVTIAGLASFLLNFFRKSVQNY